MTARGLWMASADGLVLVDAAGSIRAVNPAFVSLFGRPEAELVGLQIESMIPADTRADHARLRMGYERDPVARPMAASRHLEGLRADGSTFPVAISLARLDTGEGPMSFAAVRDLTDRVRAEAVVARANRRRALAEDHDRIASELHDTVIQRLFVLGLGLQGLPDQIADPDVAGRVGEAVDTLDDIIRDIRTTIYGLRDRSDPASGLRQRVAQVVGEMEASLGFAPDLAFAGPVEEMTDAAVIEHLLPVVREALSNVARHAGASRATVTVRLAGDQLSLEVLDDGVGIPDNVNRSGLGNLADRALALGGSFEVAPNQPAGTALRWTVPRPAPAEREQAGSS
ncbi:MAG: PAS domain S-box protein [Actinomycetota bacterium]